MISHSIETNLPQDFPSVEAAEIGIFWDYENIRIPRNIPIAAVSKCIQDKLAKHGRIVEKRLYYNSLASNESPDAESYLASSGFTLVDCPNRGIGRKENLDKELMIDAAFFGLESVAATKTCVVLITSDGDYSHLLARLRGSKVNTIIIYDAGSVAQVLIDSADVTYSWKCDILGSLSRNVSSDSCRYPKWKEHKCKDDFETSYKPLIKSAQTNIRGKNVSECPTSYSSSARQLTLLCRVLLHTQQNPINDRGRMRDLNWVNEGAAAETFYKRIGKKDNKMFQQTRNLAFENGYIKRGQRNDLRLTRGGGRFIERHFASKATSNRHPPYPYACSPHKKTASTQLNWRHAKNDTTRTARVWLPRRVPNRSSVVLGILNPFIGAW